jgi:hypothetical protein
LVRSFRCFAFETDTALAVEFLFDNSHRCRHEAPGRSYALALA